AKTSVLSLVTGQGLSGANVTMAPAATITGTVNLPPGTNQNAMTIVAFDASGNGNGGVRSGWVYNNSYSLNLPAGSYKLVYYESDY
ncbi:hypothetical protein SB748_34445, partial [Rhizobium sp. SIMBA_035]